MRLKRQERQEGSKRREMRPTFITQDFSIKMWRWKHTEIQSRVLLKSSGIKICQHGVIIPPIFGEIQFASRILLTRYKC